MAECAFLYTTAPPGGRILARLIQVLFSIFLRLEREGHLLWLGICCIVESQSYLSLSRATSRMCWQEHQECFWWWLNYQMILPAQLTLAKTQAPALHQHVATPLLMRFRKKAAEMKPIRKHCILGGKGQLHPVAGVGTRIDMNCKIQKKFKANLQFSIAWPLLHDCYTSLNLWPII